MPNHKDQPPGNIWSNPIKSENQVEPTNLQPSFPTTRKAPETRDFFKSDGFHLLLFVLTVYSTYLVQGQWYAFTIITILGAHEGGHYLMSKKYGVVTTLPYFIPFPLSLFGTMGAVIKMKSPIPSRQALFDIGIAGPLAGLIFTVPAIIIGLKLSVVIPVSQARFPGTVSLGDSLLFKFLQWLALGKLPPGTDVILHPIAFAGWVGLFVTALNLLPIGQLDGGHLIYAVWGKQSKQIYLAAMGIMVLICIFYNPGWVLLLVLIALFGFKHPPPMNDFKPLDRKRKILGLFTLLIFLLSFTPNPISINDHEPTDNQPRWARSYQHRHENMGHFKFL